MNNLKLTETEQNEMEKEKLLIFNEMCERCGKEHEMVCPSCGGMAHNQFPNGAGIIENCHFYCLCGWTEEQSSNSIIELTMSNKLFEVITEGINNLCCDVMCGNDKDDEEIFREDFYDRVLPTVKIELTGDTKITYTMSLNNVDFITLYNEIIWGGHESYGAIKYDWFRENTKELCKYLINIKNQNGLVSGLDNIKNILWFID